MEKHKENIKNKEKTSDETWIVFWINNFEKKETKIWMNRNILKYWIQ
jgi:hypothetical protein